MAHYAHVKDGIVTNVVAVTDPSVLSSIQEEGSVWVKTSYNTHAGQHAHGKTPLRKNFAGIGMIYDSVRDCFYWPQPYPSWILNEQTAQWEAPVPPPEDVPLDRPRWDEDSQSWVEDRVNT